MLEAVSTYISVLPCSQLSVNTETFCEAYRQIVIFILFSDT